MGRSESGILKPYFSRRSKSTFGFLWRNVVRGIKDAEVTCMSPNIEGDLNGEKISYTFFTFGGYNETVHFWRETKNRKVFCFCRFWWAYHWEEGERKNLITVCKPAAACLLKGKKKFSQRGWEKGWRGRMRNRVTERAQMERDESKFKWEPTYQHARANLSRCYSLPHRAPPHPGSPGSYAGARLRITP